MFMIFFFSICSINVSKCKLGSQSVTISYYLGLSIFDLHFEQCLPILFDSTVVV